MKIVIRISLIILFFFMLMLNVTCKKNIFHKITYEGYVFDSIGGTPQAWVTVKLSACSSKSGRASCTTYDVGSSITDVNGHFYIRAASAVSGRYHVQAAYTHFDPYIFSVKEADLKTEAYTTLYIKYR